MKELKLEFNTIPLGRKNERRNISDELADLLEEKYLCLEILKRISNRKDDYYDNYELVPVIKNKTVDFMMFQKDIYNINDQNIEKAIQLIEKHIID